MADNVETPAPDPEGAPATPPTVEAPDQAEADQVQANVDAAASTLADVPAAPAPTPEELAAGATASLPTVDGSVIPPSPPVLPTPEVEASNPSNVTNAVRNEAVAENVAQTDAAIAASQAEDAAPPPESAPLVPPTGPPPPSPPVPAPNPSTPVAALPASGPLPALDDQGRQMWVCLNAEGLRNVDKNGVLCPPFPSDNHLLGIAVVCPNCGGQTVIRREGWDKPL